MAIALSEAGHEVIVCNPQEKPLVNQGDIVIRFGGLLRAKSNRTFIEIHEYASSSTGRFPRTKNIIKCLISGSPDGRIFVDEWVKREFCFSDKIPCLIREQGAPADLLKVRDSSVAQFDVIYCGSITGRPGVISAIRKISLAGLSVAVAGNCSKNEIAELESLKGVCYFGSIDRSQITDFLSSGSYGLNFCPDTYPFRHQVSTKVLEYLVAGRPIISNKYSWIDRHSLQVGYSYVDLDSVLPGVQLTKNPNSVISRASAIDLTFPEVFKRSAFIEFLESLTS